jgi:hypothetical protein
MFEWIGTCRAAVDFLPDYITQQKLRRFSGPPTVRGLVLEVAPFCVRGRAMDQRCFKQQKWYHRDRMRVS